MLILIIFSFIAGVVTILSPCILPILPIILSGGVTKSKSRPLGIITGFILSFTVFTLFLSAIVRSTNLSPDFLRMFAVVVVAGFGLSLLIPSFQLKLEQLFSRFSSLGPKNTNLKTGFWGGIVVGLSLGLLWTPCVGPILASVITLAATGEVSSSTLFITFFYALGTAIPLFFIMISGNRLLTKVSFLSKNLQKIQKIFGVLMILTALAILTNFDRKFQTYILDRFPNYGTGLTKFEDNAQVEDKITSLKGNEPAQKPLKRAPELVPGGEWFNSDPLTIESLKGKVILVDFWTYTCINCQRTFPYLKSWWSKYEDDGLVIIGVHSPEFEFEKDASNVAKALLDFGITYPVVQDNNFSTWKAYNNRYWPAKYLIDKEGNIVYTHFGEGDYDETEQKIQELLETTATIDNTTYDNNADTSETYLGYGRIANFTSQEGIKKNLIGTYTPPDLLLKNKFAFRGEFLVTEEYSSPQAGSRLYFNYEAQRVHLVMNPIKGTAQVNVYIDSVFVETITVDADSLYTIVDLPEPGVHLLELEFLDSNLELYAFTFG